MDSYAVENIDVTKIHVGMRRRAKIGSLVALKSSLERVGQIHPITVRLNGKGFELIAGERRLKAAEALDWKRIRARVGRFSDEQLREIELDENTVRNDLSDFEASKAKLRQIQGAEREAQVAQAGPAQSRYRKRGEREAARRTGLSRQDVQRTKRHVQTAEVYPALQGSGWKRSQVLAAGEALDQLPKRDRTVAVQMVAEPGVDPKSAVTMLETLVQKPVEERREIVQLYRSGDPEKQSTAITRAARLPPMPDPRYTMTQEMLRLAHRCRKAKRDDLTSAYDFIADEIEKIIAELDEAYDNLKRRETC